MAKELSVNKNTKEIYEFYNSKLINTKKLKNKTVLIIELENVKYIEEVKKYAKKACVIDCSYNCLFGEVFENINKLEIQIKSFLQENGMSKFDVAIMNPPYDGNLHLCILNLIIQKCTEVINISPIRWLQDPLAESKTNSDYNKFSVLRNSIKTLDVVPGEEVQHIFNINWGDLGIYRFGNVKCNFDRNNLITCPKFIIDFVLNLSDTVDKHKSKMHEKNFIRVPTVYNPSGGNPNNLLFTQDINKCLNVINEKDNIRYFNFKTQNEAKNFFYSMHLKLYRYIKKVLHETHNTPFNRLPWLGDYTHSWTDKDIYKKFKFSKEEIAIIESEV